MLKEQMMRFSLLCLLIPLIGAQDDSTTQAPIEASERVVRLPSKQTLYAAQSNPVPYRMSAEESRPFKQQAAVAAEEEEYQQAMQAAGLRSSSNHQASYPFASEYSPYGPSTVFVTSNGGDGYYGQESTNKRVIHGEKSQSSFANDLNMKPEANFNSQSFDSPKGPNFDVPSEGLSNSQFFPSQNVMSSASAFGNFPKETFYFTPSQTFAPNQGFNGQVLKATLDTSLLKPQGQKFSGNMPPLSSLNTPFIATLLAPTHPSSSNNAFSNNNGYIPAIAIAHPIQPNFNQNGGMNNNGFNRQQGNKPYRPMMNQGPSGPNFNPMMNQGPSGNPNMMGANTLTMPVFLSPNVMNRLNMPYPGAFSPMMYPSPMFIPTVNPYSPFFPSKNNKKNNKQKNRSENRDDRDDTEELFEDDTPEDNED